MSAVADRLRELRLDRPETIARAAPVGRPAPERRPVSRASVLPRALILAAMLGIGATAGSLGTGWALNATGRTAPRAVAPIEAPAAGAGAAPSPGALVAAGFVVARRGATVGSQITGQLREVLVHEGDRVAAGQVIARLVDDDARAALVRAQAQAAMARASLDAFGHQRTEALATLHRREALRDRGFVTAASLDEALADSETLGSRMAEARANIAAVEAGVTAARIALDRHVIRAPFGGVVVGKNVEVGELVSPVSAGGGFTRTGVASIVDMSSLGVEVDVSEAYIGAITPGQPVALTLDAIPGARFKARVAAVIPSADRNRATVRVAIVFAALDPRILPQMAVKAAFLRPASNGDAQ